VVCCKDTNRKGQHAILQFDYLGYTFRPRLAKWRGRLYGVSFLPAASPKALKAIRQAIRGWSLQTRSDKALDDLARMFNPYIRGWINYYSHFYKSALYPTLRRIDAFLLRWARRKFKRLRQRPKGARDWLARVIRTSPDLFAHWPLLYGQGRTLGAV
jgi:RNA-directed DNA polymerase